MAVDPGVEGGLAVLAPSGMPLLVTPFRKDWTHKELVEAVKAGITVLAANGGYECWIEKVGYIGKRNGKKGDGGKGANTFGRVDGLIRGTVLTLGVHVNDVMPMLWQAKMECLTGGNKNISKDKALELFDGRGFKITHATADALLIAEFGRRSKLDRTNLEEQL